MYLLFLLSNQVAQYDKYKRCVTQICTLRLSEIANSTLRTVCDLFECKHGAAWRCHALAGQTAPLAPGETGVFEFHAERLEPRIDNAVQLFTYVGAIDGDELGGINAGLVGSLLWFAPSALPGGRLGPRAAGDVDRELVLLLLSLDLDPARSALAAHNAANIGVEQLAPDSGLVTLNGLAYGPRSRSTRRPPVSAGASTPPRSAAAASPRSP